MSQRAVFLDRDGVLNHLDVRKGKPFGPTSMAEYRLVADAPEQVQRLRDAGYLAIVITNQPGVARGELTQDELDKTMAHLGEHVTLDDVCVCLHDDADGCACRKPKPGMLLDAAARHGIDLARSCFVGDTWKDMAAARAAGCAGVLIDACYNRDVECDVRVASLEEAVDWVLGR